MPALIPGMIMTDAIGAVILVMIVIMIMVIMGITVGPKVGAEISRIGGIIIVTTTGRGRRFAKESGL